MGIKAKVANLDNGKKVIDVKDPRHLFFHCVRYRTECIRITWYFVFSQKNFG